MNVFVILRIVFFGFTSILWGFGLVDFYKHHNVFPYNGRNSTLLVLFFGLLAFNNLVCTIISIGHQDRCLTIYDTVTSPACRDDYVLSVMYNITTPIVCATAVWRGVVLLFLHKINGLVIASQAKGALSTAVERDALLQNWWMRHRYMMKPKFFLKSLAIWALFVLGLIITIASFEQQGEGWANLISNAVSFIILLIGCPFLSYHLSKVFLDTFGILDELKYGGGICVIGILLYTVISTLYPTTSNLYYLGPFTQLWCYTTILILSLIRSSYQVDRSISSRIIPVNGKTQHGTASKLIMSRLSAITVNGTVLKVHTPNTFSFQGILRSAVGYEYFMRFLEKEFATESLKFWRHTTDLRHKVKIILGPAMTVAERVAVLNGDTEDKGAADSVGAVVPETDEDTHSDAFQRLNSVDTRSTNSIDTKSSEGVVENSTFYEQAIAIFEEFITTDAVSEVNLPGTIAKQVHQKIARIKECAKHTPAVRYLCVNSGVRAKDEHGEFLKLVRDCFRTANEEISNLMQMDSFRRFEKSQLYQEMQREMV